MVIARRIAYNVVLNSFLKVFSTVVLSLLSIRLMTEYLGPDGFGKYSTALAFFAFFAALADLGLGTVTAREISREGARESFILGNVVSLRLLASLSVIVLSPGLIFFFHYPTELKTGIFIASCAILFSSLSSVLNGIFQKHLSMDRVALVELFGKLAQVGMVVAVVRYDLGFLPMVATLIVSLSFNATVSFLLSRRYIRFRLRIDPAFWKEFLKESLPLGATAIITFAYFKMDTILLSIWQSSADVGIYNVAYKIMENLIFFPAMLAGLILPLLSRYIFSDRKQFETIAQKTFKVFFIIVVPLLVGTWVLAGDIVRIVSGTGFESSVSVLRLLIFALGCIFFGHYFNMLLVVGNAQRLLMKALLVAAVCNIALNSFLIPRYSYTGAAVTSVLTEMLVVILTATLTGKYVRYFPSLEGVGKALLSGGAMAGVLLVLAPHSFLAAGAAGVAVYGALLWGTRAITSEELRSIFFSKTATVSSAADLPPG